MQPNSAISHLQCKPSAAAEQQYFATAPCPAALGGEHLQVHTPHLMRWFGKRQGTDTWVKCLSGFGFSADDSGASTEVMLATTNCIKSSSELAKGNNAPFDLLVCSA